jgi:hypothetical protein
MEKCSQEIWDISVFFKKRLKTNNCPMVKKSAHLVTLLASLRAFVGVRDTCITLALHVAKFHSKSNQFFCWGRWTMYVGFCGFTICLQFASTIKTLLVRYIYRIGMYLHAMLLITYKDNCPYAYFMYSCVLLEFPR